MRKIAFILLVFAFLNNGASAGQSPKVGDRAPDFSIVDAAGREINLGDFKGKRNVILIFYAEHD